MLLLTLGACAPAARVAGTGPTPVTSDIGRLVDSLPLRDRIAQLVIPWIPGTYEPFDGDAFQGYERWVDSLHVGGIIVSIGSPLDIAAKINRLQSRAPLPLLVTSDLESGTTFRFIGGTPFPPNMGVGASGSELDAYQVGRVTALEGRAVGIHMTFAPVADLNSNPANPVINIRSFGEDPRAVSRLVAASIKGVQDHGMFATAKHFPGHGDTGTDSHMLLPTSDATWARLDSLELVPFRAAISAGVAAVMSGHIALTTFDSGQVRASTVAPAVLTGVLRDSLHFHGVTVTDALNMGALVTHYGAGEAAVLAFLAGADILLQPADPWVTVSAMEKAVHDGRVSEAQINRSLRRVLELKRKAGVFTRRTVPLDSIADIVGRADFQCEAADIAARSIVLAIDSAGVVDSLRAAPRTLTLVSYGEGSGSNVGTAFAAELRAQGHAVTPVRLTPASGPASYDSARAVLARNPYAVFAISIRGVDQRGTMLLANSIAALVDSTARLQRTLLVSFGSPYVVMQSPHVGSYLLAWTSNAPSERAAARALRRAPITGHLPIRIPPRFIVGDGLQRPAAP